MGKSFNEILDEEIENKYKNMSDSEKEVRYKKHKRNCLILFSILAMFDLIIAIIMFMQTFDGFELNYLFIIAGIIIILCVLGLGIFLFVLLRNKEKVIKLLLKQELKPVAQRKFDSALLNQDIKQDFHADVSLPIYTAALFEKNTIYIDKNDKKFVLKRGGIFSKVYKFSDVINYEIYENGKSVVEGRAGSSLIGGLFFGMTGALIGGSGKRDINDYCNKLSIIIRINDWETPQIEIILINGQTLKSSSTYSKCVNSLHEICSYFELMLNNKKLEENIGKESIENKSMTMNKLKELKSMLDEGYITQEEFDRKKEEFLNKM